VAMTEAETRAALRAFVGVGGLEPLIAERPWEAVPGGWWVRERFAGWRFRLEPAPGGVRVVASARSGSRRRGSCRAFPDNAYLLRDRRAAGAGSTCSPVLAPAPATSRLKVAERATVDQRVDPDQPPPRMYRRSGW
jgi:hypothetical protein